MAVEEIGHAQHPLVCAAAPVGPGEERTRRPMARMMREGNGRLGRSSPHQPFPLDEGGIRTLLAWRFGAVGWGCGSVLPPSPTHAPPPPPPHPTPPNARSTHTP